MRINKQIQVIQENLPILNLQHDNSNPRTYSNIPTLLMSLKAISNINHVKTQLEQVHKHIPKDYHGETIALQQNIATQFDGSINKLKVALNDILAVLKEISTEEEENSLYILLPDYPDFNGFVKDVRDFGKIFDQVLSGLHDDSTIKFQGVDLGTSWLVITFTSVTALGLIAGMIWSACVIRKKKLEGDHLAGQVKNLDLKNESINDLVAAQKKLLDLAVEAEANYLIDKNNIEKDPEYTQRLIHSIENISEMINRGTQFHPSLSAPEEASRLFPDYKKLNSISSNIKQIKDNSGA